MHEPVFIMTSFKLLRSSETVHEKWFSQTILTYEPQLFTWLYSLRKYAYAIYRDFFSALKTENFQLKKISVFFSSPEPKAHGELIVW